MLDIGFQELIVIFGVALMVFGPRRLPELARTLGKGVGQAKKALFDIKAEVEREVNISESMLDVNETPPLPRRAPEGSEPAPSARTGAGAAEGQAAGPAVAPDAPFTSKVSDERRDG